jgi:EPS-associated MarR family transcriptional regulator
VSNDEVHFRVMRLIQENSQLTQRELARQLGISLGKANYCLKALVEKGFVKAENFQRSDRKLAYAYLLTPAGIDEKARVTVAFLRRKVQEFETLKAEIESLQTMAGEVGDDKPVRNQG